MNDYHSIIKLSKLKKPVVRIGNREIFAFLGDKYSRLTYQKNSDSLSLSLSKIYVSKAVIIICKFNYVY